MSEGTLPNWNNLRQQRQVVQEAIAARDQDGNNISSSSHVHPNPHPAAAYVVPMPNNYEVAAELRWENGQLAMHGLTGILPRWKAAAPPTFGRAGGDTLESIVHQATHNIHQHHNNNINKLSLKQIQETTKQSSAAADLPAATSGGKRAGNMEIISAGDFVKKNVRSSMTSESQQSGRYNNNNNNMSSNTCTFHEDQPAMGGGGTERSASARPEKEGTMMTWNSFDSDPHGSFKTKTTDDDSACHDASENRGEEMETKGETVLSHSARRSRAALIHNQSERRRRDRINQKMKALQKLVPNASKTDKASMLDEVINYLKQLQSQVEMMSSSTRNNMMMNPLAIQQQQQLQMSLLARMGMGVGLGMGTGMLDINALARAQSGPISTATLPFVPPHFVMPTQAKSPAEATTNSASVPFADPYSAFLAQQAVNMDFYKMAALYQQQANQATQATSNSQANIIQR